MDTIDFIPREELVAEFTLTALSETADWGFAMSHISEAHKTTKGEGITVAVLDSGCFPHSDLLPNLLPGMNMTTSDTAEDRAGHGTHVSGIIAAAENDMGVIGVAPRARILPIKVLDDRARGNYAWIEAGIRAAVDAGVNIINMSLGAQSPPPPQFYEAIRYAADRGVIMVAAAGNDSSAVNYPARYDEVIAVGAVDQNSALARFSSRGDALDLVGPGVSIYSTYLKNDYAILQGTSQASPFISGVCALLMSYAKNMTGAKPINNYVDMLRELDLVSDPAGRVGFGGKEGEVGFGIPNFANIDWSQV